MSEEKPIEEPQAVEQQFFMSPLELVIHGGQMQVQKVPVPQGVVTILQFVTPSMTISLRLDDPALDSLVQTLTGGIMIPRSNLIVP